MKVTKEFFLDFLKGERVKKEFIEEVGNLDEELTVLSTTLRGAPETILDNGNWFFWSDKKTDVDWGAIEKKWVALLKEKGYVFDRFMPMVTLVSCGENGYIFVGDSEDDVVHKRGFIEMTPDNFYLCYDEGEKTAKAWEYGAPISEVGEVPIRVVKVVDDEGVILIAKTNLTESDMMNASLNEAYDELFMDYEMRFAAEAEELGKMFSLVQDIDIDDVISL